MDADYTVLLPATTQTEPPCEEIQLADSIFKECLAECNITSLNTAIYLLMTVVYAPPDAHSQTSRSLEQLADAYLTRFSHTGNWEDMQRASLILSGLSAGFSHVHVSSVPNSLIVPVSQEEFSDLAEVEETLEDIVALAMATRAEFDGAVDVSSLSTAILIYQEAITTHDLKDRTELETFRELSNALLIRFRLIGQAYRMRLSQVKCDSRGIGKRRMPPASLPDQTTIRVTLVTRLLPSVLPLAPPPDVEIDDGKGTRISLYLAQGPGAKILPAYTILACAHPAMIENEVINCHSLPTRHRIQISSRHGGPSFEGRYHLQVHAGGDG
ncbi:hypothetical protein DFH06DRAFT_1475130 [Mycena polygramma]|nr:hypothetical protein DFH06DRAFT_1475130 [Mycena polygramma]